MAPTTSGLLTGNFTRAIGGARRGHLDNVRVGGTDALPHAGRSGSELQEVRGLAEDVRKAFEPLRHLYRGASPKTIAEFANAHVGVAEALAGDENGSPVPLWSGEAGEALALLLAEVISGVETGPRIAPRHYAEMYRALTSGPDRLESPKG